MVSLWWWYCVLFFFSCFELPYRYNYWDGVVYLSSSSVLNCPIWCLCAAMVLLLVYFSSSYVLNCPLIFFCCCILLLFFLVLKNPIFIFFPLLSNIPHFLNFQFNGIEKCNKCCNRNSWPFQSNRVSSKISWLCPCCIIFLICSLFPF